MNTLTQPTIIVGAGFTGLFTALHLRHQHYPASIILIDPQERFGFKPMLYEYLSGEMQDEEVFPRYEELLQGSDITFVQDQVTAIDLPQRQVDLASGLKYTYSYLVLSVGNIQGYFGTEGAQENAFPFRTRADVIALEKHLRDCLQRASQTEDTSRRRSQLTFAVVGAGPTGVELAATLADLLPDWYTQLGGKIEDIRIVLINHGEEILTGDVNAHLRDVALDAFKHRTVPVELLLGTAVKAVYSEGLDYERQGNTEIEKLVSETVIWTAGTAIHPLIQSLSIPPEHRDKHGLPLVSQTLRLIDFPEVFMAGDCAVVRDHPQPPIAQVAYQQGAAIAHNLVALVQGNTPKPAKVNLRGTLMKLGINNGVANLFDKIQINGKAGDLIRNATYLELLPTPLHNFKATTEWLVDETFHRYQQPEPLPQTVEPSPSIPSEKREFPLKWALAFIIPIALIAAVYLGLRNSQPELKQPQPSPEQTR